MSEPYRCPVCWGKGLVPPGFYSQRGDEEISYPMTSSAASEACHSCSGRGIVWSLPDKVWSSTEAKEPLKPEE